MNFNLSKIKISGFKLNKVGRHFSLNPGGLWKNFIWFLIFFSLIIFAFNGWVYYRFYFNPEVVEANPETTLKMRSLENALGRMDKKEEKYQNIVNGLNIEDPI